jgi:ribosomal protein S18 acetylase RimI-like enzyme
MAEDKEKIGPQIHFRDATVGDIPKIKELLISSWVEHARNEPEMLDEERMRSSNVEAYYQKALSNPKVFVKIAEVNGQFAGFLRADIKNESSFFKYPRFLWIDDIAVINTFRNQKVGHFLIKEAEKIAKKTNIEQIQARVYSYNHSMQVILNGEGYHSPHSLWVKTLK